MNKTSPQLIIALLLIARSIAFLPQFFLSHVSKCSKHKDQLHDQNKACDEYISSETIQIKWKINIFHNVVVEIHHNI